MSIAGEIDIREISAELQAHQRQRAWHLKSRIMVSNRLLHTVAGTMGYSSGLKESERDKLFAQAKGLIKLICLGEVEPDIAPLVRTTQVAIDGFDQAKLWHEKAMEVLAKQLHVVQWVQHPDQKGFGIPFLAIVIGETGDLTNYGNPAKVWRRLGCAPFTKDGVTLMGATWRSRSGGKKGTRLTAEDWEEFGYSPRRRSIAYLIGEGLMKQNAPGPYRKRYDEAKAKAALRDDWTRCQKCDGTGRQKKAKCPDCKGTGKLMMRCHRHGMLLAAKLLLKNLWLEWNDYPEGGWKE